MRENGLNVGHSLEKSVYEFEKECFKLFKMV